MWGAPHCVCEDLYCVWRGHTACVGVRILYMGPYCVCVVHTVCIGGVPCVRGSILWGGSYCVCRGLHCVCGSTLCVWVHNACIGGPTAYGFVQHSYFEFLAKEKMLKILENFCCSSQPLPFLSQPQNMVRNIHNEELASLHIR